MYIKTADGKINIGKSTRPLFAYVPQGNLILSGTIRENICFGSSDSTDERIIECAKVAQIWGFISNLEDGLDTVVGEKGLGLSEGQVSEFLLPGHCFMAHPSCF